MFTLLALLIGLFLVMVFPLTVAMFKIFKICIWAIAIVWVIKLLVMFFISGAFVLTDLAVLIVILIIIFGKKRGGRR